MAHPAVKLGTSKASERQNEIMRVISLSEGRIPTSTNRDDLPIDLQISSMAAELAPGICDRLKREQAKEEVSGK